jgi:hypothetical protein
LGNNWDSFLLSANIPRDQRPQRRFPSTGRESNISLHRNRKDHKTKKYIVSHISPTVNALEERQAKKEKRDRGGPGPKIVGHNVDR